MSVQEIILVVMIPRIKSMVLANMGRFWPIMLKIMYLLGCLFQSSFQWWWFLEQNQWYHVKCHELVGNIAKCKHPGPDHKIDGFLKIVKKCSFFLCWNLWGFSIGKVYLAIVHIWVFHSKFETEYLCRKQSSIQIVAVRFQKIIF